MANDLKSILDSNSDSNLTRLNNSNSHSKIAVHQIFRNLTDVVPYDDYMPYYVARYKQLGYERFMELANKSRAGGKDPKRLFFWMLKNNELVK